MTDDSDVRQVLLGILDRLAAIETRLDALEARTPCDAFGPAALRCTLSLAHEGDHSAWRFADRYRWPK